MSRSPRGKRKENMLRLPQLSILLDYRTRPPVVLEWLIRFRAVRCLYQCLFRCPTSSMSMASRNLGCLSVLTCFNLSTQAVIERNNDLIYVCKVNVVIVRESSLVKYLIRHLTSVFIRAKPTTRTDALNLSTHLSGSQRMILFVMRIP